MNKQKKVLFITNIPSPYRVEFFDELGKYCNLTVLFERRSADDREWNYDEKTNYTTVFMKGIKTGADSALCFDVLKYLNSKYDVIVIGGYSTPTGMLAIEYLKLKRIPFYLNCDGGFIKQEKKSRYLIKRHFIKSASYWLSSGQETNKYLRHYGAKKQNIYNYPFTSVKQVEVLKECLGQDEKNELKKGLGIVEEKVLVSVGQFIHRKGFDVLIKASKKLESNVGIYIIGGTPTEEYIKLVENGHGADIHFVGFCDKEILKKYYRAADCMVFPTREDIWGLVINEAMANGLPVISSDKCIAALEIVGDAGFIVPSEDDEALYNTICKVLDNPNLQEEMSKRAREKAREYTIENMAHVHMQIFDENM